MNFDIQYNILNYDLFYSFLSNVCHDKKNKYSVNEHAPIGYSDCGFPILHYSIGSGPYEVLYMGGAHGNEIIGVDFVLQLMKNMALGKGVFSFFNPDLFTIHFVPLQNPEGFFTTTYSIDQVLKDKTPLEKQMFCKQYYQNYRKDNQDIMNINKILSHCYNTYSLSISFEQFKNDFWSFCRKSRLTLTTLFLFLEQFLKRNELDFLLIENLWNQYIGKEEIVLDVKSYQKPFLNVTLDAIPELTDSHKKLKHSLDFMYQSAGFPFHTLANFCANGNGVNLNENNSYYFQEFRERARNEGDVFVAPIYGSYFKNIPGPFGVPCEHDQEFSYASENLALLSFLEDHKKSMYAFVNCHGTGGLFYFYPYDDLKSFGRRDFSFYINNRIATEYLREVAHTYQVFGNGESGYRAMGHPDRISGVGDYLRARYPGHFLLELSKSGGNPLGPYIEPNYTLTMSSNMNACMSLLNTILEVQHLYGKTYEVGEGNEFLQSRLKKK